MTTFGIPKFLLSRKIILFWWSSSLPSPIFIKLSGGSFFYLKICFQIFLTSKHKKKIILFSFLISLYKRCLVLCFFDALICYNLWKSGSSFRNSTKKNNLKKKRQKFLSKKTIPTSTKFYENGRRWLVGFFVDFCP